MVTPRIRDMVSALVVTIALGVLVLTDKVGSWVVVVPGAMGMIVACGDIGWKPEQKKRNADDEGE